MVGFYAASATFSFSRYAHHSDQITPLDHVFGQTVSSLNSENHLTANSAELNAGKS